jgi:hypothetical protein
VRSRMTSRIWDGPSEDRPAVRSSRITSRPATSLATPANSDEGEHDRCDDETNGDDEREPEHRTNGYCCR